MSKKFHSDVVVERCEALKKHILEFPETFDMEIFMCGKPIDAEHPCGTVGCIGGTLVFLEEGPLSGKVSHDEWDPTEQYNIAGRAADLLEITEEAAGALFYESDWPGEVRAGRFGATPEQAVKRIDYFLETGI